MQDKRPIFSSTSLAGRMKQYDAYRPVAGSLRAQVKPAQPQATSHNQNIFSKPASQSRLVVQQQTNRLHNATHAQQAPAKVSLHNNSNKTSLARRAALYSVAHAEATHEDVLADQFVGGYQGNFAKRALSKAQKAFYGIGVIIFIFATGASVQTFIVNKDAKEQLQVLGEQTQKPDEYGVVEGTGSDPAEAEVPKSAITAYKVDPELPRYLRIPELGVFARIKHTGIDKNGAIDAPANINDVSWYKDSAKPGNAIGSSLLLGHVSGWTAPGVFKKINQLKPGMRFEVEKGNGEKLAYEVTRGESIPLEKVDMAKILASDIPGEHDLKLMTCSGRYNKEKDIYEERYVVYAKILR